VAQVLTLAKRGKGKKGKGEKKKVAQVFNLCRTGWKPVPPNSKKVGATRQVAHNKNYQIIY